MQVQNAHPALLPGMTCADLLRNSCLACLPEHHASPCRRDSFHHQVTTHSKALTYHNPCILQRVPRLSYIRSQVPALCCNMALSLQAYCPPHVETLRWVHSCCYTEHSNHPQQPAHSMNRNGCTCDTQPGNRNHSFLRAMSLKRQFCLPPAYLFPSCAPQPRPSERELPPRSIEVCLTKPLTATRTYLNIAALQQDVSARI
mmetsp:Transcript_119243/g.222990  ORF Transcript_119243/g.222990 Transcript_119243/m.222990 type:complete len:201 (-) Transcript_119243:298-900(-)